MNYRFFNKLVLRTPAFSFENYNHHALNELCKTDFFKTAILLASRSLYTELDKKGFEYNLLDKKQQYSILKYYNRMCYRPTPFGLFAGYTLLSWKEEEDAVVILERHNSSLHVRPGQELSISIGNMLNQKLKNCSQFRANSSIYRVNREFRYYIWEKPAASETLEFSIETFADNSFIRQLLSYCKSYRDIEDIADFTMRQTNCNKEQAVAFANSLISRQILQSSISAAVTGMCYAQRLTELCKSQQIEDEQVLLSGKILTCLNNTKLPDKGTVNKVDQYLDRLGIKNIPPGRYYNSAYERTDVSGGLSASVMKQLTESLTCIDLIAGSVKTMNNLEKFTTSFQKKFEGRTLPLLNAIDPETGAGYGDMDSFDEGELLQTIGFKKNSKDADSILWTEGHRLLMKLWKQNPGKADAGSIEITDEDLAVFKKDTETKEQDYPTGISVIFRMINGKIHFEQAQGACSIALLGRFSLFSPEIKEMATTLYQLEEAHNPDVIFAEIIHLCDGYVDNINRRESLLKYDIPVLCRSELPEDQQIPLTDLYVSVKNGQVLLFSSKNKKRVVPRLSSAFNYIRNDLPVFRFLCDLQYQAQRNIFKLDLADFFPGLRFYPRVEYKNIILHLASWHLQLKELQHLYNADDVKTQEMFKAFADKKQLTRYFSVNRNDHQLVFDSENTADVLLFKELIKNEDNVILREFIPDKSGLVTDENNKRYINQFIACLYNEDEVYKGFSFPATKKEKTTRKFAPGSEWLYLKIYCHPNRSNELISSFPFSGAKIKDRKKWFFIRYNDPEYHIRLRLNIAAAEAGNYLLSIEKKLKEALRWEQVEKLQADTYIRELERYGHELITDAEEVFYRSSELIAAFLKKPQSDQFAYTHSGFALYTVNETLKIVFPKITERLEFITSVRDSFLTEYSNTKELKLLLDRRFRALRTEIDITLNNQRYLQKFFIGRKFILLKNAVHCLMEKSRELNKDRQKMLYADILHMHMNRIFVQESRKQETATYYFLYKYNLALSKCG